jgi:hypothetical protein
MESALCCGLISEYRPNIRFQESLCDRAFGRKQLKDDTRKKPNSVLQSTKFDESAVVCSTTLKYANMLTNTDFVPVFLTQFVLASA